MAIKHLLTGMVLQVPNLFSIPAVVAVAVAGITLYDDGPVTRWNKSLAALGT